MALMTKVTTSGVFGAYVINFTINLENYELISYQRNVMCMHCMARPILLSPQIKAVTWIT